MKKTKLLYLIPVLLASGLLVAANLEHQNSSSDHSTMTTSAEEGDKNFDKMMEVLTHRRCVNCHPSDNVPKQGEDSHPHYFGLARGSGDNTNHGFDATNCNTCHQDENNDFSGVPGAPEWSLAPASMKWEGLTRVEIAESMLDRKRNGNRSHEDIMHHLTEHALVLWAWEPGIDAAGNPRETPPVPKDEYIAAVKQWFKNGAKIPAK